MEDAAHKEMIGIIKSSTEEKREHTEGRHIEFIFTNIGCYHDHHLKAEFLYAFKTLRHVFFINRYALLTLYYIDSSSILNNK